VTSAPTACTTTEPAKSWKGAPKLACSQSWTPKRWFQAIPSKKG
jgi:hypothetical protein